MVSSIYGIIKKKMYDFVCKMRVQAKDGPMPYLWYNKKKYDFVCKIRVQGKDGPIPLIGWLKIFQC